MKPVTLTNAQLDSLVIDTRRQYAELALLARENLEALNRHAPAPQHPYRSLLRVVLRDLRSMPADELRNLAQALAYGVGVHSDNHDTAWTWLLLSQLEAVCLRLSRSPLRSFRDAGWLMHEATSLSPAGFPPHVGNPGVRYSRRSVGHSDLDNQRLQLSSLPRASRPRATPHGSRGWSSVAGGSRPYQRG
jgi:hypothetical protein